MFLDELCKNIKYSNSNAPCSTSSCRVQHFLLFFFCSYFSELNYKPFFLEPIPVQEATVEANDSSLTINWSTPEGAIHTAYKITCRQKETSEEEAELRFVNSQKTMVTFSGLTPETEYEIEIYAVNGKAESTGLMKSVSTTAVTEVTDGEDVLKPEPVESECEWCENATQHNLNITDTIFLHFLLKTSRVDCLKCRDRPN